MAPTTLPGGHDAPAAARSIRRGVLAAKRYVPATSRLRARRRVPGAAPSRVRGAPDAAGSMLSSGRSPSRTTGGPSCPRTCPSASATARRRGPQTLGEAIEQLKHRMIEDPLRECGSKTRAAERLGLTRQSLQQMLRRRQSGA